tara:strand:- start:56557 stop:57465 length:909 start_codon:yes stop_codon:yes gene_type:complete
MRVLKKYDIEDFLFIDIETAHGDNNFTEKSPMYDAWFYDWDKDGSAKKLSEDPIQDYYSKSTLFAEYGRIVCITIGLVRGGKLRLKSFTGDHDEKALLEEFNDMLETFVNNKTWLSGHAITGFDGPYIMKRCLINQVKVNPLFDVAHLKPWEVNYMDTMTLWKSTSWSPSSLIALSTSLGLPSSKDDISGKDVGRIFYEGGLDRIVTYCEKDVVAVANIISRLRFEELLEVAEIVKEGKTPILNYLRQGGKYTDEVKQELQILLDGLEKKDKALAVEILNTIPTRAKGKVTHITKKDIKELT